MAIGDILSSAGGIIGGIIGQNQAAGDAGEARNQAVISNQILQEIAAAPDISKPLILEKYRQQGILTPQIEQQIAVGVSQAAQAKGSSAAQQAQLQALQLLQQRATGGLTASDRNALEQMRSQVAQDATGRQKSIQQQMQARGLGGGGAELAAQLAAAQGSNLQESQQASQLGAIAAQNALQAAGQTGQLGGNIEQQQFGEQYQTGKSADAFRQFDVENQLAQQQRNVGAQNTAQQYNLNQAQGISNMNTAQQNKEMYDQLQRQMQEAGYNRDTARLKAGGAGALSSYYGGQAKEKAQAGANLGAGIGGGLSQAAGMFSGTAKAVPLGAEAGAGDAMMAGAGETTRQAGPYETAMAWKGGEIQDYRNGGQIPGQANYSGDHPGNDTVHAMLSPGELVVPRTIAKTSLGKRIKKLLDDHHAVMKDVDKHDEGSS